MTGNVVVDRIIFIVGFGLAMWALWWARRADERRRSRRLGEVARQIGLELEVEETDTPPFDYPRASLAKYRNLYRGKWRGEDVILFDEYIPTSRDTEIHTVVGFRRQTTVARNLFSVLRLWQVAEYGGWTWVYRRFFVASPRNLEAYMGKCYAKAFEA
jgi:hypothetical protein